MKKLFQFFTVLTLVLTFSVISAFADSVKEFNANIPFQFNVGQKSYPAGDYVIKVKKLASGASAVSFEDKEGNLLENVIVTINGDVAKEAPQLIFNRYENQRFLAKILTPEKGFTLPESKVERDVAGKNRQRDPKKQVAVVSAKH